MSQARVYAMSDPVAVAAKLKAAGGPAVDPTQTAGMATADGVTLSWHILGGQIFVTIVQKPWMIGYSTIWNHVDSIFQ
jgi:hypothetical protein